MTAVAILGAGLVVLAPASLGGVYKMPEPPKPHAPRPPATPVNPPGPQTFKPYHPYRGVSIYSNTGGLDTYPNPPKRRRSPF